MFLVRCTFERGLSFSLRLASHHEEWGEINSLLAMEKVHGGLDRRGVERVLRKKRVAPVRQTREIIFAKKLIDPSIISSGVVNPVVPGGPFEPLGRMRPAFVQALEILNLSIQVHVIEAPGGPYLCKLSIADRVAEFGEFLGPYFIQCDGEVVELTGKHRAHIRIPRKTSPSLMSIRANSTSNPARIRRIMRYPLLIRKVRDLPTMMARMAFDPTKSP